MADGKKKNITMASAEYRPKGYVFDYVTVVPISNYQFQTGVTYLISSFGYFSGGSVTLQPGCVIKLTSGNTLLQSGTLICNGTAVSPSIITSKDDDLFGERIAGSTGAPAYSASPALWCYYDPTAPNVSGVRIRWAQTAVQFDPPGDNGTATFNYSTLEQCQTGLYVPTSWGFGIVAINNSGMCGVQTPTYDDTGYNYAFSGSLATSCNGDSDGDGLPDYWEIANFGSTTAQSAMLDYDGDGIINMEEYKLGTNPTQKNNFEPMGASSRKTGLTISEIMYHPVTGNEFIELYNGDIIPYDLNQYKLINDKLPGETGSVVYKTFGATDTLAAGNYLQVSLTGDVLPNSTGTIRLMTKAGAIVLEVNYSDKEPWPIAADGFGYSLVLKNPSYGENDYRAWGISANPGGSPGFAESASVSSGGEPIMAIRINEWTGVGSDFIELFNTSNGTLNLQGCTLKDGDGNSYTFSVSTPISPRGFFTLDPPAFGLGSSGDSIVLISPASKGSRVIDAVRYTDVSQRCFTGAIPRWSRRLGATFDNHEKYSELGAQDSNCRD